MARKIRNVARILLAVSLILALCIGSASAASYAAWINSSSAKIYIGPGKSTTLHAGTPVLVTGVKKGWAQINCNNKVGYVRVAALTMKDGIQAYVDKANAYIYKSASKNAAKAGPVPVGTQLMVVGVNGQFCQVTDGSKIGYMAKGALSRSKPSEAAIIGDRVQLVEWSKATKVLAKGSNAYLYDIMSGATIHVHRLGGTNHMELEPLTAEDTAKLKAACGGTFSWDSRPVIFCANGKLLAAAINTMPHGEQSIQDNDFDGQFCMHFPGSKTHGTNTENASHQAAVKYAYKWAKSKI